MARVLWLPWLLALGACSTYDIDSFRAPDLSIIAPRATATLRETQVRPVTTEELVDTGGRCTGVPVGPDPNIPPDRQQDAPMLSSAIGLDMTECDVVRRAGHPEKVDFATNARNERSVTLTYLRGPRPGIYHFTAGRLTSIERVSEPAPPPRQQRKPAPRRATG